ALLLLASTASAQIPAALEGRRVADVQITGETSGATGAHDVGIPLGAPLTRELLRSTTERLLESGRWADVQIDAAPNGGGVVLFVHLVPRVIITRVDVSGNTVISHDEVVQALGLGPRGELEREDLSPLARSAADTYAERGYVDARVTLRLRDTDDPTRKVLLADIVEGEPLRVIGYAFEDDPPPGDFDLPDELGLGVGSVLDRTRLQEGVVRVTRRLRESGWLEARVGRAEVRREEGGARIVLPLETGPRYEVRLIGREPLDRTT